MGKGLVARYWIILPANTCLWTLSSSISTKVPFILLTDGNSVFLITAAWRDKLSKLKSCDWAQTLFWIFAITPCFRMATFLWWGPCIFLKAHYSSCICCQIASTSAAFSSHFCCQKKIFFFFLDMIVAELNQREGFRGQVRVRGTQTSWKYVKNYIYLQKQFLLSKRDILQGILDCIFKNIEIF